MTYLLLQKLYILSLDVLSCCYLISSWYSICKHVPTYCISHTTADNYSVSNNHDSISSQTNSIYLQRQSEITVLESQLLVFFLLSTFSRKTIPTLPSKTIAPSLSFYILIQPFIKFHHTWTIPLISSNQPH